MRNRRRMEWKKKKWWNLKVGGLRSGQSFASLVGACACVCSTGECPPLLGFGWDFLVNPSFPRPSPLPLELFAAELRAMAGGRGTRRKRESGAEWKRRGESEWLGERERSIFETPVPLGTELLSPPHAQWRSKGGAIGLRTTTLPVPRILDERKFGTKRRSVINWPRRDSGITRSCRLPYPSLFFLLCINFHRIPEFNNTSISKFSYSLMRRIIR